MTDDLDRVRDLLPVVYMQARKVEQFCDILDDSGMWPLADLCCRFAADLVGEWERITEKRRYADTAGAPS